MSEVEGGGQADEKLRAILLRRAERLARSHTDERSSRVVDRIAVLEVGAERIGVPVEGLREIVLCPPIAALPGLPPWIRGVVQLRGELMTVVDLGRWLGIEGAGEGEGRLAVIATPAGPIGLLAARVAGFREVEESELSEQILGANESGSIRATTRDLVAILDLARIADDPRLIVGRS
jgi:purine-binding chemotaxis protein CheW